VQRDDHPAFAILGSHKIVHACPRNPYTGKPEVPYIVWRPKHVFRGGQHYTARPAAW